MMVPGYVVLKFLHILIAVIALGTSAGLGSMLELYGSHPTYGIFMLRAIRRLVVTIVIPGYLLVVITGTWLAHVAWSLSIPWIRAALSLWLVGAVFLSASVVVIGKKITLLEARGPDCGPYRRITLLGGVLGGASGLVIVAILYLMVARPVL